MDDIFERLLADGVIDEFLGRLKSGKEAEVFLVRHRGEIVAAKVYKDRQQRNFKSNAVYKEGRQIRNSRTRRAVEKGSRFGQREAEEAWKSAEADMLYRLHAEGVRVPTPKMFYEGVLLMQLVTDAEGQPAPRLIDAPISVDMAAGIYRDIRRSIVGMLCCDLIHGDLSPYNVLLGAEGPMIIDFPQMMSAAHNNQSEMFFRRDYGNIHRFLSDIDPSLQRSRGDAQEIWSAYLRRDLTRDFTPSGVAREERRRPPQELRLDPRNAFPHAPVGRNAAPPRSANGAEPRHPSPPQTSRNPPRPAGNDAGRPQAAQHNRAQKPRQEQHRQSPAGRYAPALEVVYVRRPGGAPPSQPLNHEASRAAAPPEPRREPHRSPRPPSDAKPELRSPSPQNHRPRPAPQQAATQGEERGGGERKGPRRRRRRRFE